MHLKMHIQQTLINDNMIKTIFCVSTNDSPENLKSQCATSNAKNLFEFKQEKKDVTNKNFEN